jgi:hypothetical protein
MHDSTNRLLNHQTAASVSLRHARQEQPIAGMRIFIRTTKIRNSFEFFGWHVRRLISCNSFCRTTSSNTAPKRISRTICELLTNLETRLFLAVQRQRGSTQS